jgi:hypothetical protein
VSDAELLRVVREHLRRFERSAFRLEALDHYTSDAEDEEMRRWFEGEPFPLVQVSSEMHDEYLRLVRAACATGKQWRRVHAVSGPTPYVRFEVEGYGENEAAGEEVRILPASDLAAMFGEQPPDFWLFDDELVLEMQYDETGRIAAIPVISDPGSVRRYLRLRDIAVRHSVPVRAYRAALRRQDIPAPVIPVEATWSPNEWSS